MEFESITYTSTGHVELPQDNSLRNAFSFIMIYIAHMFVISRVSRTKGRMGTNSRRLDMLNEY